MSARRATGPTKVSTLGTWRPPESHFWLMAPVTARVPARQQPTPPNNTASRAASHRNPASAPPNGQPRRSAISGPNFPNARSSMDLLKIRTHIFYSSSAGEQCQEAIDHAISSPRRAAASRSRLRSATAQVVRHASGHAHIGPDVLRLDRRSCRLGLASTMPHDDRDAKEVQIQARHS